MLTWVIASECVRHYCKKLTKVSYGHYQTQAETNNLKIYEKYCSNTHLDMNPLFITFTLTH